MSTVKEFKARVTLGRIVIANHNLNLGQCNLSYLRGSNPYNYLEFLDVFSLYFVDKEENCRLGTEGVKITPTSGAKYRDLCRSFAYDVAEKMRERGIIKYEIINGRWVKMGKSTGELISSTSAGSEITPMPEDGIELFRRTLEERLKL